MRILAIDTSTPHFTLGIYDSGKVFEYNLELGRLLSELLHPTIKRALDAAGLKVNQIDYFACGLGPGSFTGIRTGLACIKGFGWAGIKPLIGISTLDILAKNAPQSDQQIIAAIDAKRQLVYCGFFKYRNGRLNKLRPYQLLKPQALPGIAKPGSLMLGDALGLYRQEFAREIPGVKFLDKDCWYPKAHLLIELALEKIKAGKLNDPFKIKPIYLYPRDCQVRQ